MSGERLLLLVTVRTFLDVRAQLPLALELGAARLAVVDRVQRVVRHVHAQLVVEAELLAALGALVLAAAVLALVVLPASKQLTSARAPQVRTYSVHSYSRLPC